jgi:hypothetical protein
MVALILALSVMIAVAVLIGTRHTHAGAERASFDPVALESAVYGELYGRRSIEVAPVAQPDRRIGRERARVGGHEEDQASAVGARGHP